MVRTMVQEALEEEMELHVGAKRHERGEERRGQRNGYKPRTYKTRVGELDLQIPQARGVEPYHPSFFGRYERSERALLVACAQMYFQGVSTRKVARVLEAMAGFEISATTVSRVAQQLDEQIAAFKARRLDEQAYPYLVVDARYEKVRRQGKVLSTALLVVAGIGADGRRRISGVGGGGLRVRGDLGRAVPGPEAPGPFGRGGAGLRRARGASGRRRASTCKGSRGSAAGCTSSGSCSTRSPASTTRPWPRI